MEKDDDVCVTPALRVEPAPEAVRAQLAQRMNTIAQLQGECSLIFSTWLSTVGLPLTAVLRDVMPDGLLLEVPHGE